MVSFTGIVITYNEAEKLPRCLDSLTFCDEIIVVDLNSQDSCSEIAREHGARVLQHEHVPIASPARKYGAKHASNEWIVYLDPDEVFPSSIRKEMVDIIEESTHLGRIYIPWQFYFKGKPLHGTPWGGKKHKGHVVNKKRCYIGPPENPHAHKEITLKKGYKSKTISWENDKAIQHYWMDSYESLIEKHIRYVHSEGEKRYTNGNRFPGWIRWVRRVAGALKQSLIEEEGWRDGGRGIFLSIFWAWYEGACLLALRRVQHENSQAQAN